MGDSLAAGTNLGPASGTYPKCGQSTGSYIELAMARVKKSAWVNSVCNGGHSGLMTGTWYGIGGSVANGDPLIPGQYNSLNGTEDVVIVGSGANEAFFGQITKICLGHDGSSEDPPRTYTLSDNACSTAFPGGLRPYTLNSEQLMGPLIDGIHSRSPNAKVILVGVPRITPRDGVGCMPDPVLTLADAPVWSVWEDTLRTSMIKVANEHDATFVDNSAISGPEHSMCAPANMRWMNPWTVANVSWPGTPLHNTPWGADAMADTLVNAIKSTGKNTGTPNAPTLTRTTPSATATQSTSQTFTYSGAAGHTLKCRLDNAAYTACPSSPYTRNSLSAGPHSFSVIQTDASGNRSPAAMVTWTIDTTAPAAPTVARTNPVATPTNSPTQTITYTGAESGGTYQCKLDSGSYAACPSSPATLSGLTTGVHTYSVTQTDAALNVSPAASVTWTVNMVLPPAPNVVRTSPSAALTSSTTQVIAYSGNQAGGTFQCSLDSAPPTSCPSSPLTLTGLGSTSHSFSVTQTDALGNVGSATTVAWTVDFVPPAAPTVTRSNPAASLTNSTTQTISYSGAEAGGTFQCKLDGAAYAACPASPIALSGLGPGSHVYSVTQTDAAGNTSAPAGTASWTVDVTPPPVPNVSGPSGITALNTATIIYSDSEAGVSFDCKLDSAAWADCTSSPISLSGLPSGDHNYSVTATDTAGNVSNSGTASWTIDPNGFTSSITANPSNPSTTPNASFSFAASVALGTSYECKLDSGSFSSCTSPKTYNSLPDGPHTFTVRANNASTSPTTTPEVSRTWIIDATPPAAPALNRTIPSSTPTNSTSQTFAITPAEAGGVLNCKLDNAAVSTCPSSPITVAGLDNGSHTYSVTQTDAAGNTGSAATVTWTVDTVVPSPPTVTRTSPTASPTNSTSQTLTYGGIEAGATTQCKLDTAAFGACPTSPLTLPGLGEGSHTLLITQTDAAGNVSVPGSISWVVDTVAPSAPTVLRTIPTASPSNSTTQQFSVAGTESGSSLQCKLDAGAYTPCPASPVTFSGLAQGAHTLLVTQTDAATNVSTPTSVSWTIDSIPPGAPQIGFNRPAVTTVNSATIGYAAAEAGGSFECSMDSAPWMPCPGNPINLVAIQDGQHNYMIRQIDAAGNEGTVAQVAWVVDTIVPPTPTVALTSPTSSPTNQTTASITVTANESGGELECKLDSAAYEECPSNPTALSGLATGPHTYYARHTDSAGNVSVAGSVSWTVDIVAPGLPTVTRTSPTANPTASTSQTITYDGAEAGGTFQCKLDAEPFAPCPSSPVTLNGLSDGTHTYSVAQTDASGNAGSASTVTWVIDTLAPSQPTVTRTAPTANPTNSTSQTFTYNGEPGGTFQCKLDAAAYSACASSPVTLTGLSEGTHNLSVTQTDALGHVSQPTTITWTVDTTAPNAPTVTRTSPTANPTNSTSQSISYTGVEAGATTQCKLDNADYAPCAASPIALNGLSSGSHSYSITQSDSAGNVSLAGVVSWVVDVLPPPTPSVSGPSGTTGFRFATIAYSDAEAGVTFQCKLDSAAYAACLPSPINLTNLADGTHTYYVTATDPAGNVSAAGTATWTVDPSIFGVSITSAPSNPSTETTASFTFLATDAGSTYECKLDAEVFASCDTPKNYTNLSDGSHTFTVRAKNGGQTTPDVSHTWVVDSTPPGAPTITRASPTTTPTNATQQTLLIVGAEPGGVLSCKWNSSPYETCPQSPVILGDLDDGVYQLSVTQTDAAGHISEAATVAWEVDTTAPAAPTVTRSSPTASPTSSTSQTISYGGEAGGTYRCKLDAGSYAPCGSSPLTFAGLSLGSHTFSVRQTDAAGNTSAASTVAWTIESPAPPEPPDTDVVTQLSAKLSAVAPKSIKPARSGSPFSLKSRGSVGSFRVRLSSAATVSLRLERVVSGRSRAATAWTKFKLKSGQTKIYLSGRTKNRALPAGTYKVHLTVGGSKSNWLSKSFRVKR